MIDCSFGFRRVSVIDVDSVKQCPQYFPPWRSHGRGHVPKLLAATVWFKVTTTHVGVHHTQQDIPQVHITLSSVHQENYYNYLAILTTDKETTKRPTVLGPGVHTLCSCPL
jgi:hypothetical protein